MRADVAAIAAACSDAASVSIAALSIEIRQVSSSGMFSSPTTISS
jgi:hypothetical protein